MNSAIASSPIPFYFGFIVAMSVAVFVASGCEQMTSNNMREYQTDRDITFVGSLTSNPQQPEYFGARVNFAPETDGPSHNISVSISGKNYALRSITPSEVKALGGDLVDPRGENSDVGVVRGYISWGEQNRDGGLEITFENGMVRDVWMHWHGHGASPFSLETDSQRLVRFPVTEDLIRKDFGPPVRVHDYLHK